MRGFLITDSQLFFLTNGNMFRTTAVVSESASSVIPMQPDKIKAVIVFQNKIQKKSIFSKLKLLLILCSLLLHSLKQIPEMKGNTKALLIAYEVSMLNISYQRTEQKSHSCLCIGYL